MPRFALQTFTVRKYLKSAGAIESSFRRIRDCGLSAVELAYVKLGPEEINAVERASKNYGVTVGSTQITFAFLDRQRDWVLQFHQQIDCELTAVSVLPLRAIYGKREQLLRFAEQLEKLGQYYRERGLQLCYHHHDFEFRHYGNDVGLDLLLDNTSAENVGLELDTYWAARGGRSPQQMITDLGGRVKVVHLRDMRLRRKLFNLSPVDCALGQGNLDFRRIIDSCVDNKVRYMAIEQATDKPFEQVALSVSHLMELGYETFFYRSLEKTTMILDQFKLDGKVAIVTGASRGLGKGMALALADAGADIVGIGVSDSAGTGELVQSMGRRYLGITADLGDGACVTDIVAQLKQTFGRVDILVNNAGTIRRNDFLDFSEEDWDSVMDLNLKAPAFLSQAVAREFVAQGSRGKIIHIASMLSFQGGVRVASYTSSKSGIRGLTMLMANELAAKGINVNAIAPGYMATDNTQQLRDDPVRNGEILGRIPAGRWGLPEDLAGAIVFLASDAANYVHGHTLAVDGGWLCR